MKDYSKANLECDDPPRDTEHCLTFCLDRLYADRIHTLNDDVVKGLSFEELIGALLSAHRDLTLNTEGPELKVFTLEDQSWLDDPVESHITIEDGFITLDYAYPYDIELSRIPDERALLHWVHHLSGKTWMNNDRIAEFIGKVSAFKKFNISDTI